MTIGCGCLLCDKRFMKTDQWATTADIDGDLAIFDAKTRQLIGVGATVQQTVAMVETHNSQLNGWRDRALKAEEMAGRLIKKSIEKAVRKPRRKPGDVEVLYDYHGRTTEEINAKKQS